MPDTTPTAVSEPSRGQGDPSGDLADEASGLNPERTTRGRMGAVPGVRILGCGGFVPENRVSNEDLAALGCDSEWIVRRTGIRERRHASEDQATSDLAYQAAVRCLADAAVSVDEVDLILVATVSPDHFAPSTACLLQKRIGAFAPAMDISAACAGFVYALTTGAQFVACGNAKRVLVVGADLMSRTANPEDKKTYPLFGDGAGAVLIGPDDRTAVGNHGSSDCDSKSMDSKSMQSKSMQSKSMQCNSKSVEGPSGILAYQLGSEGGTELLCIPAGGTRLPLTEEARRQGLHYFRMDGRSVFKWAVDVFDESAKDVLRAAQIAPDELALVVMHQANQRIIDSAVSDLGLAAEKVYVNLDRYGNTSAASIPIALDEAIRGGKLRRGDYALLSGFGSGLAWGSAIIRY